VDAFVAEIDPREASFRVRFAKNSFGSGFPSDDAFSADKSWPMMWEHRPVVE
jgi:hypothetical protein